MQFKLLWSKFAIHTVGMWKFHVQFLCIFLYYGVPYIHHRKKLKVWLLRWLSLKTMLPWMFEMINHILVCSWYVNNWTLLIYHRWLISCFHFISWLPGIIYHASHSVHVLTSFFFFLLILNGVASPWFLLVAEISYTFSPFPAP